MMKLTIYTLIISCLLLAAPTTLMGQSYQYDSLKTVITEEIVSLMKKNKVTGLSVALVDDQKVVWAEGFGFANKATGQKATAETVYRVGSISKLFTATAIMQLAEQRRVDIDQPYKNYVPNFSIKSRFEGQGAITPRNMMMHYSGMISDYHKGFYTNEVVQYSEIIPLLKDEYTAYPPNFVFSYSNVAYSLLGYLVETVSKQAFEDYIDKHIFQPLDMVHSSFIVPPPDYIAKLQSKAYKRNKEGDDGYLREMPAGMMASNVLDLSNFMKMTFNQGQYKDHQIIKSATLDSMQVRQNADAPMAFDFSIGLGWWLEPFGLEYANTKVAGHGGDTYLFHADMLTLPEYKLGAVVLTNSQQGVNIKNKIVVRMLELALETKAGIKKPDEEEEEVEYSKHSQKDFSKFKGQYATLIGPAEVKARRGHLKIKKALTPIFLFPNEDNKLTAKMRLLYLIPIRLGDEFDYKTVGEHQLILADDLTILGEKITDYPEISDSWKNRLGQYEVSNQGNDTIIAFDQASLEEEDGLLNLEVSAGLLSKRRMVIKPLNNTEAITLGFGRSLRETVRFEDSEEGEIMWFSGYRFLKK